MQGLGQGTTAGGGLQKLAKLSRAGEQGGGSEREPPHPASWLQLSAGVVGEGRGLLIWVLAPVCVVGGGGAQGTLNIFSEP